MSHRSTTTRLSALALTAALPLGLAVATSAPTSGVGRGRS